ncbi:DNA methyltransferase [Oscillatoriales cyanobacterium USR001]|nr:DNA methyltransferase [Oscillatoriales cyanobacterium USR001]
MLNSSQSQILPRPFLKWAGGKSRLIPQYSQHFPKQFTNYYEPFLGGGAVFFHLQPKSAVLTDINADLINTYCCVKDRVEELITYLKKHELRHNKEYYYDVRSYSCKKDIERAARLIYLNKTCFNGLYRENSKGEFNVPIGKYKNPMICNADLLRSVSTLLQSVTIEKRPFEDVLHYANSAEDFVYFDPPYFPINDTSYFTSYSRDSFTKDDQVKLRDVFVTLASRGVKVLLSNSDCEFIRELYSGFKIKPILAARAINSKGKLRGKVAEVLIISY